MLDLGIVFQYWPQMAPIAVLAIAFWAMFRRSLSANSDVVREISQSNQLLKNSLDDVLSKYRALSEDQVKELERNRALLRKATDENILLSRRYDDRKSQLSSIQYEYNSMKKLVERLESLAIATGGDVKVISRELSIARESLQQVNTVLQIEDRSN